MTKTELEQIQQQLPEGASIVRLYQAFEGDVRVIVKLPGENCETRYTVIMENDYPHIKLMP